MINETVHPLSRLLVHRPSRVNGALPQQSNLFDGASFGGSSPSMTVGQIEDTSPRNLPPACRDSPLLIRPTYTDKGRQVPAYIVLEYKKPHDFQISSSPKPLPTVLPLPPPPLSVPDFAGSGSASCRRRPISSPSPSPLGGGSHGDRPPPPAWGLRRVRRGGGDRGRGCGRLGGGEGEGEAGVPAADERGVPVRTPAGAVRSAVAAVGHHVRHL